MEYGGQQAKPGACSEALIDLPLVPCPPQVASAQDVQLLRQKATELGFDVSVLKKVEQQGCVYN